MDCKDNSHETQGTPEGIGGSAHRVADLVLLAEETSRYSQVADAGQAHCRRQGRRRP